MNKEQTEWQEQLAKIEQAIAAQEGLRGVLDDTELADDVAVPAGKAAGVGGEGGGLRRQRAGRPCAGCGKAWRCLSTVMLTGTSLGARVAENR